MINNKLIIDIGNTSVKTGILRRGKLLSVQRHEALTDDVLQVLNRQYKPVSAIVASVRNKEEKEETLLQHYFKKIIKLSHKTPVPIRNLYATPETLGMDRLAAAVGANFLFPHRDCLIIDCGTAITIDFLSRSGEFIGGNISPGLQARFKALHHFTARLPMGTINEHIVPIGTNTQEAVESGVLQGAVNELEGYIEHYSPITTILTGGDAIYFAKKIKNPIFVICNLNFVGLAKIANYNAHI